MGEREREIERNIERQGKGDKGGGLRGDRKEGREQDGRNGGETRRKEGGIERKEERERWKEGGEIDRQESER